MSRYSPKGSGLRKVVQVIDKNSLFYRRSKIDHELCLAMIYTQDMGIYRCRDISIFNYPKCEYAVMTL